MNNEGNKTTRKIEDSTKSASMTAARPSAWKKLLSKRWVFPAAYMAVAAIIVTILWLNAGNQGKDAQKDTQDVSSVNGGMETKGPEAQPAAVNGETLRWPVDKFDTFQTEMAFYDVNGTDEQREAAMVEYDNKFMPHTGVDLARKDAKDFDVRAALSGKVTFAEQTPLTGYEVTIQHADGVETVYQSLKDLQVKVGDEVKQGEAIAKAGTSQLEASKGPHVHFEVLNNGEPVNPVSMIKAE